MSSDLLDQMKISGNTDSNEERNIPWSQQVDDHNPSDICISHINEDTSPGINQSGSTQFQYPPFNAKERDTYSSLSNNKARRSTANSDYNKKYNNKSGYNTAVKDDYYSNAWNSGNTRKIIAGDNNSLSNINKKTNRYDGGGGGNINRYDNYYSEKLYDKSDTNYGLEKKKMNIPESAPKKTTWASIASQPAKLSSRTNLTTSSHKKKGPGMPPPPMIPGKHDLDVNTWDLPNNNPTPPPIPPPIDTIDFNETINFSADPPLDLNAEYRAEKNHSQNKNQEILRDDNNRQHFGSNNQMRNRNSQSVHQRKHQHWSMQNTTMYHHGKQFGGGDNGHSGGAMPSNNSHLANDGADGNGSRQNRYGFRKKAFPPLRNDDGVGVSGGGAMFNYRDNSNTTDTNDSSEKILETPQAILEELRDKNNYNPTEIDLKKAELARFFVIKSYSEDDIHRSIKYEIWCSTDHGNKRLDDAFKERQDQGGHVLLFFSVNGSGHFCGMAQMMTAVDYNSTSSVWAQDKWKGKFKVKWIYVKDVPNNKLRHITLENNENKPVTNSRDTQEVPNAKGIEVLHILHSYKHSTSIFDDFYHYEKKQEEEVFKKPSVNIDGPSPNMGGRYSNYRHNNDVENSSGNGQKYFNNGSSSYERGASNRGNYNSAHNDYRRYDGHRGGDNSNTDRNDYKDDTDRENNEYGSASNNSRYITKTDYNRRIGDDRGSLKYDSHDSRDYSDNNYIKSEARGAVRSLHREKQQHLKDNECSNSADRARNSDY